MKRDDHPHSLNDDSALIDLFCALSNGATSGGEASVAVRLIRRGYPSTLAVRVACTPPFSTAPNTQPVEAHEGAELAQAIDALTGDVAAAIVYWERWAP